MYLITGASGLVGSAVARMLVQANLPVSVLCRATSDMRLLADIQHKIVIFEGDVLDVLSLEKALENTQFLVHSAGMVSFSPKDKAQLQAINVTGTANVVNACLAKKSIKLCHVSSIAALGRPMPKAGNTSQSVIIAENQPWEESELNSFYGKTKYWGELEVWRGIAEGLNAVIVNPTIILGEGDWHKSSSQLFRYVFDEKKFYPSGNINYVDVQDVSNAILGLLASDISGKRFSLNGGSVSYKDFLAETALVFGTKPPKYSISPAMANILWRIEAVRSWFTGKSPLITRETAKASGLHFQYPATAIAKVIDHSYTPLNQTIQRCALYFLQSNDC